MILLHGTYRHECPMSFTYCKNFHRGCRVCVHRCKAEEHRAIRPYQFIRCKYEKNIGYDFQTIRKNSEILKEHEAETIRKLKQSNWQYWLNITLSHLYYISCGMVAVLQQVNSHWWSCFYLHMRLYTCTNACVNLVWFAKVSSESLSRLRRHVHLAAMCVVI